MSTNVMLAMTAGQPKTTATNGTGLRACWTQAGALLVRTLLLSSRLVASDHRSTRPRRVANTAAITRKRPGGSIYSVGRDFQPFRINGLEMVDQIFPRWNPLTSWLRSILALQSAA